jgi:hypothetical protein
MSKHLSDGALGEARGTSGDWRAVERQHGAHPPVGGGICLESQLPEDLLVWAWTVRSVTKPVGDGQVREPVRQEREDLPFPFREP